MTPFIRGIVAGAALAAFAPFTSATVLTFDDLAVSGGSISVPANYGGLNWSSSTWTVLTEAQDPYTAHSGDGRIYTDWGSDDAASTIRFDASTVFDGAWFSGFGDVTVKFLLYVGNELVATSSELMTSATPTFLSSGWSGAVDSVVVSSASQTFYVMDDFTFHAIPEPGSLALLLAALGIATVATRRRA